MKTDSARRVAFVFDDGPIPDMIENSLAVLAKLEIAITFACTGEKIVASPTSARAAAEAGHELVNHSFSHPHFSQLEEPAIRREIQETQSAILSATGTAARWFWPPYLDCDERIEKLVLAAGVERFPISRFELIGSQDWNRETDAETIRKLATQESTADSVILCHEWRRETWEQLPAIVANLRERGCQFVTFSNLTASVA